MSRENFCQKVQCPFWNPRNSSCDRFLTAHNCPIAEDLPPRVWDNERGVVSDSYVTQYALSWDDRCIPFEQLKSRLTWFLLNDKHYQQVVYLSESGDTEIRRRVDSGTFFRTLKIKSAYLPVTRELIHEVNPSWSLVKIDSFNLCTFSFPVADLLLFDEYIEDLEAVGDE